MKTILRNFVSVLRRFKMAMLLNVFGLSIAFAAFMVIMMQVNYDYTFDSCQPEADAIYRMDMDFREKRVPSSAVLLQEALQSHRPILRPA